MCNCPPVSDNENTIVVRILPPEPSCRSLRIAFGSSENFAEIECNGVVVSLAQHEESSCLLDQGDVPNQTCKGKISYVCFSAPGQEYGDSRTSKSSRSTSISGKCSDKAKISKRNSKTNQVNNKSSKATYISGKPSKQEKSFLCDINSCPKVGKNRIISTRSSEREKIPKRSSKAYQRYDKGTYISKQPSRGDKSCDCDIATDRASGDYRIVIADKNSGKQRNLKRSSKTYEENNTSAKGTYISGRPSREDKSFECNISNCRNLSKGRFDISDKSIGREKIPKRSARTYQENDRYSRGTSISSQPSKQDKAFGFDKGTYISKQPSRGDKSCDCYINTDRASGDYRIGISDKSSGKQRNLKRSSKTYEQNNTSTKGTYISGRPSREDKSFGCNISNCRNLGKDRFDRSIEREKIPERSARTYQENDKYSKGTSISSQPSKQDKTFGFDGTTDRASGDARTDISDKITEAGKIPKRRTYQEDKTSTEGTYISGQPNREDRYCKCDIIPYSKPDDYQTNTNDTSLETEKTYQCMPYSKPDDYRINTNNKIIETANNFQRTTKTYQENDKFSKGTYISDQPSKQNKCSGCQRIPCWKFSDDPIDISGKKGAEYNNSARKAEENYKSPKFTHLSEPPSQRDEICERGISICLDSHNRNDGSGHTTVHPSEQGSFSTSSDASYRGKERGRGDETSIGTFISDRTSEQDKTTRPVTWNRKHDEAGGQDIVSILSSLSSKPTNPEESAAAAPDTKQVSEPPKDQSTKNGKVADSNSSGVHNIIIINKIQGSKSNTSGDSKYATAFANNGEKEIYVKNEDKSKADKPKRRNLDKDKESSNSSTESVDRSSRSTRSNRERGDRNRKTAFDSDSEDLCFCGLCKKDNWLAQLIKEHLCKSWGCWRVMVFTKDSGLFNDILEERRMRKKNNS